MGIGGAKVGSGGVSFDGPLTAGYKACLWSRSASRVLLTLGTFPAATPEQLYDGVRGVRWTDHMDVDQTFAIDFNTTRSAITHTNFGALKSKDAIADWFRDNCGRRPSVDRDAPDLQVNVHLMDDEASLAIDLSGESLHRRKWRGPAGAASLKENLAAGILLLTGWPATAAAGGALIDPMCGAGTLPIEAALMAANIAPGLRRKRFGFERWRGHDRMLWGKLVKQAKEARIFDGIPPICGFDAGTRFIGGAKDNAGRAGVADLVRFERRELAQVDPVGNLPGIFVVNPPYGERLGTSQDLLLLYRRIGMTLKHRFQGWTGHIFTGNREAARNIGLRVASRQRLFNGAIECRLLSIPILEAKEGEPPMDSGAGMFANRLRKNLRRLKSWRQKDKVSCYRIYDADLPEFALSIELYGDKAYVREQERPDTIDPLRAEARLHDALAALQQVCELAPGDIFIRQRRRQRGTAQYGKVDTAGRFIQVDEGGMRFFVNLSDYFDTGLFLDHRPIRALIGDLARGRDFLNLFGYTGTASVYAGRGGARTTTTVDMSKTYLEWAQRNLDGNGLTGVRHQVVAADVLSWLQNHKRQYGLIFLDPPTFSNSKSMRRDFDVQRDHVNLLQAVTRLLAPNGVLIFSNNFRRFKMDVEALPGLTIENVTSRTLPPDFDRSPRIHNCWLISLKK